MDAANRIEKMAIIANVLNVSAIAVLLILAFFFQFVLHELPCPLCILQRAGFLLTSSGYLFNLRFGLRPSHYVVSLLSGLLTSFIALRQIALHVVPGTGSYGSSFLGWHLYSWSFFLSMILVVFTCLVLAMDRQYFEVLKKRSCLKRVRILLFGLIIVLAFTNFIAVTAECGFTECPDDPTSYLW